MLPRRRDNNGDGWDVWGIQKDNREKRVISCRRKAGRQEHFICLKSELTIVTIVFFVFVNRGACGRGEITLLLFVYYRVKSNIL